MEFKNEIADFISDGLGGITIMERQSKKIVYADKLFQEKYGDNVIGMFGDDVYLWLGDCPDIPEDGCGIEWEWIDTDNRKYYKINSTLFTREDKKYELHYLTDITEYMGLNRDITKYMSFFKRLSGFQTAVLEKLSSTYYELLPMLADYFMTNMVYFVMQREEAVDIISYSKMGNTYSNDRISMNTDISGIFAMKQDTDIEFTDLAGELKEVFALSGSKEGSKFRMLCGGEVSGQKYGVYLSVWPNMDYASMKEQVLLSVIRLYLENGLMREKLIYASEHDHLTGLYNKGKYLAMLESEYPNLNSIAILNFDVNDLKTMNDTYGHEAGDKLIIKAANSIRKVLTNKIHGYRMGGDEFLMVACDVSYEEADRLKERWEQELERLNSLADGVNCVMAVGLAHGSKEYRLSELLEQADKLMYEDKKRKKKPGAVIR